jgi:hypothetical protein
MDVKHIKLVVDDDIAKQILLKVNQLEALNGGRKRIENNESLSRMMNEVASYFSYDGYHCKGVLTWGHATPSDNGYIIMMIHNKAMTQEEALAFFKKGPSVNVCNFKVPVQQVGSN